MGPAPKCHFVSGLPNGNPEIRKVKTPTTLGAHNFMCKPPIEMKSKAKLYPLSKDFQLCCMPPKSKKIEVIPDFWWSRVKLPI